jgi:hypothetical protein
MPVAIKLRPEMRMRGEEGGEKGSGRRRGIK